MTNNNSIPNVSDLTDEQKQALLIQLTGKVPGKRGRRALISDERIVALHSASEGNRDFGHRLLAETLSNGSTGLEHWGKGATVATDEVADLAAQNMAPRISKLRGEGLITKAFAVGRPADPETAMRKVREAFAKLTDDQREAFLSEVSPVDSK